MSNIFGERLRVATFGESHGEAVGCVVDGCPAGLPFAERNLRRILARDVPIPAIGTPRREPNRARILSGVCEGFTIGTPIAIVIANEDAQSDSYEGRRNIPRPGHAELAYLARYGRVDWRGGGRASGRECIARLAASAISSRLLATRRIRVRGRVTAMAGVPTPDQKGLRAAVASVLASGERGESTGGVARVEARGLPAGLGEPVFDKLGARLAHALLGIGGVRGIEFGVGRGAAEMTGTSHNDPIVFQGDEALPATNLSGGLMGGISTGLPLEITLWVKPTPSIAHPQRSVDLAARTPVDVSVEGRFDLNMTPRIAVVAEAMVSLVLADALIDSGHLHPTRLDRRGPGTG